MKRKFNKLPLIILLIAGIVLSGTAVLALNNDILSFEDFTDRNTEISSTPPMLQENNLEVNNLTEDEINKEADSAEDKASDISESSKENLEDGHISLNSEKTGDEVEQKDSGGTNSTGTNSEDINIENSSDVKSENQNNDDTTNDSEESEENKDDLLNENQNAEISEQPEVENISEPNNIENSNTINDTEEQLLAGENILDNATDNIPVAAATPQAFPEASKAIPSAAENIASSKSAENITGNSVTKNITSDNNINNKTSDNNTNNVTSDNNAQNIVSSSTTKNIASNNINNIAEENSKPEETISSAVPKIRAASDSSQNATPASEVQTSAVQSVETNMQNGSVNVLVITPSYTPVRGAVVSISKGSTGVNSGGWGTITAPAGNYIYVANAPGYRASAGSLVITPNGTSAITIVLIPEAQEGINPNAYSASFILTNQIGTGEAVVSATVETENISAVSNAAGIAVLNNLTPGIYQVKIGGPDYYDTLVTVAITDADITQAVKLTKTESAIAASAVAPSVQQPAPVPASRPAADNSYKKPSSSSNAQSANTGNSSSTNNTSSNSTGTNKNDEEEKVVLDEIKEGGNKGIGSTAGEDSEIIESGELTPQTSATPSPQPTKTPTPIPTPTPVTDTSTYTVSFNLTNLNGTSVAGMNVELHSEVMTAKTDTQGFVTFENVPEGEHNLYLINNSGDVTASKAFSINSGVQTELDIANVGGDKVYVGIGTDSVTIDAVVDGSLMALTSVAEGTQPKAAPLTESEEQTSTPDSNLMWMLIISVSAAVIAVIILLLAIRKMKKAKAVDIHSNGAATMSVDAKDVKKSKFKR